MVAFTWRKRPAAVDEVVNLGPLALIEPLLDRLNIEEILDRHLRRSATGVFPWPGAACAVGGTLVPAHGSGQRCRLGREVRGRYLRQHPRGQAQRRSPGPIPRHLLRPASLHPWQPHRSGLAGDRRSLERLHFDPTNLLLCGAIAPRRHALIGRSCRRRRASTKTTPTFPGDRLLPAGAPCHGYSDDRKMMQIGQLAVVDYGASSGAGTLPRRQSERPSRHPRDLPAGTQHLALPDHMCS